MSSGHKTVTVFLTLICGLILTIVGYSTRWPHWAWPTAALVLTGAFVTALRLDKRDRDPFPPQYLQEPDRPLPPVERRELRITDVALPSQLDDYDFFLSATVRWCPLSAPSGSPPVNQSGLAVEAVLERAARITAVRHPSRGSLVQHELNGALATMLEDSACRVQAMAQEVTLTLSDQDEVRLAKLSAVRKDEAVWEHERKYEQSRRAYLGTDVLQSTGSAVVWWLHKNNDRVDKAVKDLGLLAQLTSAANDEDVSERLRHLLPSRFPGQDPEDPPPSDPQYGTDPQFPGWDPLGGATQSPVQPEIVQAFSELLRAAGLSADDPESTLLAEQVASTLAYRDGEQANELRQHFKEAVSPTETPVPGSPAMNGAGPGTVPPPESTVRF
ncbi:MULTISPECIES: hypothetical protein [unclassified Streptomyces]|uniref:hypothetical protein n=1 Tax=unclassified Streptomyces TaxID=2593676 RepID=UPI00362D9256